MLIIMSESDTSDIERLLALYSKKLKIELAKPNLSSSFLDFDSNDDCVNWSLVDKLADQIVKLETLKLKQDKKEK